MKNIKNFVIENGAPEKYNGYDRIFSFKSVRSSSSEF